MSIERVRARASVWEEEEEEEKEEEEEDLFTPGAG